MSETRMRPDSQAQHESAPLHGIPALLLLLALILLIGGFPLGLFGLFLAITQGADGMGGDVAFRFSIGGGVAIVCALGIREYLRRRDAWF